MTHDEIRSTLSATLNTAWYRLRESEVDLETICRQLEQTAKLCLAELSTNKGVEDGLSRNTPPSSLDVQTTTRL